MNRKEKEYINEVNRSEDAFVFVGSKYISTNLYEHARLVDFFASVYGLGACKSLSEFWDMIDKEDPVKLELLNIAARQRMKEMYGSKEKNEIELNSSEVEDTQQEEEIDRKDKLVRDDNVMAEFLINMGADTKEVSDALTKSGNRKINTSVSIADITSENLVKKDFDLDNAIKRINTLEEGSQKFNVGINTIVNRFRKKR